MGCLPRFGGALLAVLLISAPAGAAWRVAPPDPWEQVDAAMVPANQRFDDAFKGLIADVMAFLAADDKLSSDVGRIDTDATYVSAKLVSDLARKVATSIDDVQAAANAGLALLDSFPPLACAADYLAVVRTAWLLMGDAMETLELVGDGFPDQLRTARYLWEVQAPLEYGIVSC